MERKSGYVPVIAGVGMLFGVAIAFGAITYSFNANEAAEEEQESPEQAAGNNPYESLGTEQNIITAPVPESSGGSPGLNFDEGIPTGTYSNPPAGITTTGVEAGGTTSPSIEDGFNSESNTLSQDSLTDTLSDYSNPAPSNDFNSTSDSLIDPVGEDLDSFEIPSSTVEPPETPSSGESQF